MDKTKYPAQWVKIAEIDGSDKTYRFRKELGIEKDLVPSIKEHGQQEPVLLRRMNDGRLQIVSGHRRFESLCKLGYEAALAVVVPQNELNDEEALNINFVENRDRKSFSSKDIIFAAHELKGRGKKQVEIAKYLGKSESMIRKYLKVFEAGAQEAVKSGEQSITEAVSLATESKPKNMYMRNVKGGFDLNIKYRGKTDDLKEVISFVENKLKEMKTLLYGKDLKLKALRIKCPDEIEAGETVEVEALGYDTKDKFIEAEGFVNPDWSISVKGRLELSNTKGAKIQVKGITQGACKIYAKQGSVKGMSGIVEVK